MLHNGVNSTVVKKIVRTFSSTPYYSKSMAAISLFCQKKIILLEYFDGKTFIEINYNKMYARRTSSFFLIKIRAAKM